MKKVCFSIFIFLILSSTICFAGEPEREYRIKAGFLYKFLLFAEWPEEAYSEPGNTIIIGIIGKDYFGNAFEPVEGEIIDGRKLIVKKFKENVSPVALEKCHILFISSSLKKKMSKILKSLSERPVITVSEVKGFAQTGGMINFLRKGNRVGFEINTSTAESAGIKFRSKLLRVAQRIVVN
jgi:hypothetical protein|tara:strand:+ start:173 stop:715 length:543 start_codon:yes stop_codon:yes gene_type:complete